MADNNNNMKTGEFRGMMIERTETIIKTMEALQKTVADHTKAIEKLKIKSSLWGFLAGSIPALVTALILLLR